MWTQKVVVIIIETHIGKEKRLKYTSNDESGNVEKLAGLKEILFLS